MYVTLGQPNWFWFFLFFIKQELEHDDNWTGTGWLVGWLPLPF
jgi:hypothetical protein